jgi:hypothetical protein
VSPGAVRAKREISVAERGVSSRGVCGNFVTAAILLGRDPPGASANLTFLHNNAGSGRAASMDIFRRPAPASKATQI